MKKIISLLVVVTLMAAFLVTSAFAAEGAQIAVNEVNGVRGEEVTLEVSISDNPGFAAGKIIIEYDATGLELVGVDTAGMLMEGGVENDAKGIVSVAKAVNVTDDGVMMTVTFKVKADAEEGSYSVSAKVENLNAADRSDVAFTTVEGAVIVPHICEEFDSIEGTDATCDENGVKAHEKCVSCGKLYIDSVEVQESDVVIEAHGHDWKDANCTDPKTCEICGVTEGAANGHDWKDATCTDPKTCEICGITEGAANGHDWKDATCTDPKTCEICGVTEGAANGHDWKDATCTDPKTCEVCGITDGAANGHVYGDWYITKEPTETEEGEKRHDCLHCDHFETMPIDAVPPTGDMIVTAAAVVAMVSVCGVAAVIGKKKHF